MSNPLLKELFGSNREEMWRQLAAELNANYVEGRLWVRDKVQVSHAGWLITLQEQGKYHHTHMRAPFLNPSGFRFTVYRKGIFTDLGKYMGMQDVEVGYPDFDRDFVIQGTDKSKLQQIFANARIRELLTALPRVHFEVLDARGIFERSHFDQTPPKEMDVLHFAVQEMKDKENLRLLFDLFSETLDELCRMGVAISAQAK